MSDGPGITYTVKFGKDFDAPWVVVHAASPDQLDNMVSAIEQRLQRLADVATVARGVNALSASGASAPPPVIAAPAATPPAQQPYEVGPADPWDPAPPQQPAQQQPGQPPAATHPEGHACQVCGATLTFASGTNRATGKAWRKWGCPAAPRGDRTHTVEWL